MTVSATQAQMMQFINGFAVSQAIRTAAELHIADHLAGGPKSATELATLSGAQTDGIHRLLRALASLGIFAESDGRFELTPLADHLRRDVAGSVWPAAIFMTSEIYQVLHELPAAVRTGEGNFERVHGQPLFAYLTSNGDRAAIFDSMMASFHGTETAAIVDAYDFSSMRRVVDLGGGNGDVLRAILAANGSVRGTLVDLAGVTRRASDRLAHDPIFPRLTFTPGDFFESVPPDGDAYLLRHIVHDWGDDEVVRILTRCRSAMSDDARLLVMEEVIPDGNTPSNAKWLDVCFLAAWTGRERTADQYATLYKRAGFALSRVIPTKSAVSIVEGRPA